MEKRISREARWEASFKGSQGLTSGCRAIEEKEYLAEYKL
jgi:hypothetical protein